MKQTPIIVHVRCEDYKRLGILIGAIGDAGDEGIQILSHEHEEEVAKNQKKLQISNNHWTNQKEYYNDITATMAPGKDYHIETMSKAIKINKKYKNKGEPMAESTIVSLIQRMIKDGRLVSNAKNIVRLA